MLVGDEADMKWLHRVSSLALMGFSVLIGTSSLQLGVGNVQNPGPGFMGFLASVLLFILCLSIFVKDLKRLGRAEEGATDWKYLTKPSVLAATLCGYAFLLPALGYLISTFFLLFVMFFVYDPRKRLHHAVIAFIIVNISYLVFYKWLRVILPVGIFNIGW
jgi:putative tricarboxylic transport membrane protein